ncbi:hypothetical protein N7466_010134 [Penicillium verhagenii]|uniref:uncharacterized protein n=1 Tax=Penicillium verhagenii TaxID=1562060 RepID=UPI0025456EBE|nr:uncharacterized protein N7466_010134 [Penicillium verhagenii]KAJ5919191.1 hypothetical protein N7466_010134 [Penicillium verhagenii]
MNLRALFLWGQTFGLAIAIPQSLTTNTSTSASIGWNATSGYCAGNTPTDRGSWCQYDINTDYESIAPNTGATREYWLYINDLQLSPDGVSRSVITANNTIPGPTLFADWGDNVIVHVTNNLTSVKNGTSLHFHGIRQNFTNSNDGVVSLTQCPIAPGHTMTYRWRALQYGTSWYHSHIGLQTWEGLFGGIVINGPASENYDEDMGVLFLNDWTHTPVDELYLPERASLNGPPQADNGLINGTNIYINATSTTAVNSTTTLSCNGLDPTSYVGKRFSVKVKQGKSYRFRVINGAIDENFEFRIDGHPLTVIAMDLVPINSYTNDSISIGMGQRYDVIIHANQSSVSDTFWIQAIPNTLASGGINAPRFMGLLQYKDAPTQPACPSNATKGTDIDEPLASLVPIVKKSPLSVNSPTWNESIGTGLKQIENGNTYWNWYLNHTTMQVNWENPLLMQLYNNGSFTSTMAPDSGLNDSLAASWTNKTNLIDLPRKDQWVYINITTGVNDNEAHPIHLHGHDFYIIEQGVGSSNTVTNLENPPRRDTAILPALGHLVVAFKTDNPGIWLMHCHIGWHTEEGFALQFLERKNEIAGLIDYTTMNQTCQAWKDYATKANVKEVWDSGV